MQGGEFRYPNQKNLRGWLLLIVASILGPVVLTGAKSLEYEVKAAMIYNFAKFVEWPAESRRETLVVGVVGDDPFGETIDRLVADKEVYGRKIRVERYQTADNLGRCDILFVADSERPALPLILEQLREKAVLTVGEMEGFTRDGGVIGFRLEGNKVRFEINTDVARRSGLKISSKLLRLALVVRKGEQQK